MPRPPRADEAGAIYHAMNRGNARNPHLLQRRGFRSVRADRCGGLERFPVSLFAYQWMNNHWHMVLSPVEDGGMSAFVGWVTLTHTQRYHAYHRTTGCGHVYQGRYKSLPVEDDDHFLVVCRYVERNAVRANIVDRAEDYRWGSLWNWLGGNSVVPLSAWPVRRSSKWVERVNQPLTDAERTALSTQHPTQCSIRNGRVGSENRKATWSRINPSTSRPAKEVCLVCNNGP